MSLKLLGKDIYEWFLETIGVYVNREFIFLCVSLAGWQKNEFLQLFLRVLAPT